MDQIITNMVSLGLLVFLFAAIARRVADDRLRCWVVGWGYIALKLWTPASSIGRLTNVCTSLYALALAGIVSIFSTMIVHAGRGAGLRRGSALAFFTLLCLTMGNIRRTGAKSMREFHSRRANALFGNRIKADNYQLFRSASGGWG